jgi:hypothetical protein
MPVLPIDAGQHDQQVDRHGRVLALRRLRADLESVAARAATPRLAIVSAPVR